MSAFWIFAFVIKGLALIAALLYVVLILRSTIGLWIGSKTSIRKEAIDLCLAVPIRNERDKLQNLFSQIEELLTSGAIREVVLVDDHSNDGSWELVQEFAGRREEVAGVRSLGEASKKRAIETAVEKASSTYVLQTDADAAFGAQWPRRMAEVEADLVVGPVIPERGRGFLQGFQQLDYLAQLGIFQSAARSSRPLMASGANLLYERQAFLKLNPFEQNLDTLSGDDVYILQSFAKAGKRISSTYHREAVVGTSSPSSLSEMIRQKVRWASKNTRVPGFFYRFYAFVVFLFNFLLSLNLFMHFFGMKGAIYLEMLFALKLLVDSLLVFTIGRRYGIRIPLLVYMLSFALYPLYVTFMGILSFFSQGDKWD